MRAKEFTVETAQYNMLRQLSKTADAKCKTASDELAKFPKGPMGLTPDNVKQDPAWQKLKKESDKAFAELRHYNGLIMKNHKKEHQAARKAERAAKYKVQEGLVLEVRSSAEITELERQLDKMFSTLGLDVEFSRHFVERLLGREKHVTVDEIRSAFEKLKKRYKRQLLKAKKADAGPGALQDFDSDLNVLFAITPDRKENDYDLVNITVKRKDPDEFHTNTPSGNATPYKVGTKK